MTFEDFKELNHNCGFHWFNPDTLRFFRSRVTNWDFITGYFISSERFPDGSRRYTMRRGNFETGQVNTVSDFGAYKSMAGAKSALKRLLTKGTL